MWPGGLLDRELTPRWRVCLFSDGGARGRSGCLRATGGLVLFPAG